LALIWSDSSLSKLKKLRSTILGALVVSTKTALLLELSCWVATVTCSAGLFKKIAVTTIATMPKKLKVVIISMRYLAQKLRLVAGEFVVVFCGILIVLKTSVTHIFKDCKKVAAKTNNCVYKRLRRVKLRIRDQNSECYSLNIKTPQISIEVARAVAETRLGGTVKP
jgi:hypothetical protein